MSAKPHFREAQALSLDGAVALSYMARNCCISVSWAIREPSRLSTIAPRISKMDVVVRRRNNSLLEIGVRYWDGYAGFLTAGWKEKGAAKLCFLKGENADISEHAQ